MHLINLDVLGIRRVVDMVTIIYEVVIIHHLLEVFCAQIGVMMQKE